MSAATPSGGGCGAGRGLACCALLAAALTGLAFPARADEPAAAPAPVPAPGATPYVTPSSSYEEDRPPPDLTDRVGVGYDGTLRGLSALSVKYWSRRIGFQLMLGMRFAALNMMDPGMGDARGPGFGLGAAVRLLFKLTSGDLAQLNLAAGVGLDLFKSSDPTMSNASNFDFTAELGLQPELFLSRTITLHALVGIAVLIPFEDSSPTGNTAPVLTLGGSQNGRIGVLAGFGFTYYFGALGG
ncbi:MAG TPA: hypothetical protein VG389_06655 [Myxococcota bacterium]|jgi:hypothetical protein|nr:hypothetical protein [Myxococcota bacterium]